MEELKRNCELCNGDASIYCPSDNAFLCYACDSKVHGANFLVARHVRSFIGNGIHFSGAGAPPVSRLNCRSATVGKDSGVEDDVDDDVSLSSSSSCVSSTGEAAEEAAAETTALRRRKEKVSGGDVRRGKVTIVPDLKVEGVLVNWCKRMGGGGGGVEERQIGAVVKTAVELLSGYLDRITSLPLRVSLAGCFWVALKVVCRRSGGSSSTCQDLKRLEQISGVPAKLILATETKLARVIKRRQPQNDHEEGWAEC